MRKRLCAAVAIAACMQFLAFDGVAANAGDLDALARHKSQWMTAAIANYEYGYNKYCECHKERPPETLVTVGPDGVVDVRHRPVDSERIVPAEARNFSLYWTIADLFELVEKAISRDAVVRVDYDPALGYPRNIFIDYDAALIGDEVDVRITRFNAQTP